MNLIINDRFMGVLFSFTYYLLPITYYLSLDVHNGVNYPRVALNKTQGTCG